jgi:hypothetical protein
MRNTTALPCVDADIARSVKNVRAVWGLSRLCRLRDILLLPVWVAIDIAWGRTGMIVVCLQRRLSGNPMNDSKADESITLSPEALKAVEEIRALAKLDSIEDAISVAIGDDLYLRKRLREGWSVVLSRGGEYWEIDLANRT